jgi:hypothetical protein
LRWRVVPSHPLQRVVVDQLCNRSKGKKVDPLELLKYLEDRYMNMSRQKRD